MKRFFSVNPFAGKVVHLTPPQILALSYIVLILIGTFLLLLPFAKVESMSFMDSLFTATSAVTVTGLTVVDTGTQFTIFGQVVIMILIQLGGIGLMTFAVLAVMVLGKKVGLHQRILIQEAYNQSSLGGLIRLVKLIIVFSFLMELSATVLLSLRWVPEYGLGKGIYVSLFHSISAFNNAGFSLWSDSLSRYVGDPIVNLVITFLFITGGLGFTVIADLKINRSFRKLSLHTKLMLVGTLVINVCALFVILFLEYGNPGTLGNLTFGEKLWGAYFQAVTPRTAGFNTIEIGQMTSASLFFTMLLMFIGAGSASTGSGIKVTTFIVMILATFAFLRGNEEPVIFKRTIKQHTILKALTVIVMSILFIFLTIFILSISENLPFVALIFEAFSAFGTVGLSMGITDQLSIVGKQVIIVLMFIGRIGPLTLAFSLSKMKKSNIRYPGDDVFTG